MLSITCLDENGNLVTNLTQWDKNQVLIIKGINLIDIPEIHFCNKNSEEALVVMPTMDDNGAISVKIPNYFLQEALPLYVYLYVYSTEISGKTIETIKIPIRKRTKPSDYIYEENVSIASTVPILIEMLDSPPLPSAGSRGLFPKEDGWYDIDSEGNASKLVTEDNMPSNHLATSGAVETAIVLNDITNNSALAPFSISSGLGTIAGIKGYFFQNIEFGEEILNEDGTSTKKYGPCTITLTKEQPYDITLAPVPESFEIGYAVGDELTITNDSKYPRCCKITEIDNNVITVDKLPFNSILNMEGDNIEIDGYQVFCPDKPLAGEVNLGYYAHAEGEETKALERASHAEGRLTRAEGQYSHVEGFESKATGYISHAEGYKTEAGIHSHAEGVDTKSLGGEGSHSEGKWTEALGRASHAEGKYAKTSAEAAHAEGFYGIAGAKGSHTEGYHNNIAEGADFAHAENYRNEITESGLYAHAEGMDTTIKAKGAHTEGLNTIASSEWQHVQGKYNVEDAENMYADIIGGGTGSKTSQRKNIQTTDWSGNLWTAGDIYLGGTSQDDKNAKKVAVELGYAIGGKGLRRIY